LDKTELESPEQQPGASAAIQSAARPATVIQRIPRSSRARSRLASNDKRPAAAKPPSIAADELRVRGQPHTGRKSLICDCLRVRALTIAPSPAYVE